MHHHLRQAGYVTNLDHATCSFMEHGFMEDLRAVTLSIQKDTDCFRIPIACTIGEHIFISEKWYRPDTWLGKHILAHELAHVVQKRRGTASRPRAKLAPHTSYLVEAEAHAAAAFVSCGRQFACSFADRPGRPRCWGPAGHYYTTYFVMLAAGVDDAKAFEMAFYAQMADQVDELDASQAGQRMVKPTAGAFEIDPLKTRNSDAANIRNANAAKAWERNQDLEVQMGLHCLNGRSSTEETERRRQILTNAAWGSFEFGLAIHPYGDSFAHRNLDHPDEMYPSGLGHAVEILHLRNPHCPDFMNRRQPLYFDYAKGLYTIVCDKTPDIHDRPLLKADLETQLRKVAAEKGDSKQIEKLRQLAPGCLFGQTLNDYCPEKQEKLAAWTDFQRTYQGVVELPPDLLRQALQFARGWQASR